MALWTTMEELKSRADWVQTCLRPLVIPRPHALRCCQTRCTPFMYNLAVHDDGQPRTEYGSWRFATLAHGIKGSYYERWHRGEVTGSEVWYVDRTYLHLYKIAPRTGQETEFLRLHCDPCEDPGMPHGKYKRVPHLHLQRASPPCIACAHIALCADLLDVGLDSVQTLSRAMEHAIVMIREEVLDRVGP